MDMSYLGENRSGSLSIFSPSSFSIPEDSCQAVNGNSAISNWDIGIEAESKRLQSSKYKGVVSQPNGRWGAQIYDKHQRVWLGTLDEEEQAAKAYDIAAFRFRGHSAMTNFQLSSEGNEDVMESHFLNSHSKDEIVDMLGKHSYAHELEQTKFNTCTGLGKERD